MQSKREYLVSKGLAKPGRGKFSNAAKLELERALSSGVKFSDSEPKPAPVVSKPKAEPVQQPVESQYILPSDYRFPEGEYRAVDNKGKSHSMREVCNTCRVSLVNHACNTPTIRDNMPVNIEVV